MHCREKPRKTPPQKGAHRFRTPDSRKHNAVTKPGGPPDGELPAKARPGLAQGEPKAHPPVTPKGAPKDHRSPCNPPAIMSGFMHGASGDHDRLLPQEGAPRRQRSTTAPHCTARHWSTWCLNRYSQRFAAGSPPRQTRVLAVKPRYVEPTQQPTRPRFTNRRKRAPQKANPVGPAGCTAVTGPKKYGPGKKSRCCGEYC